MILITIMITEIVIIIAVNAITGCQCLVVAVAISKANTRVHPVHAYRTAPRQADAIISLAAFTLHEYESGYPCIRVIVNKSMHVHCVPKNALTLKR